MDGVGAAPPAIDVFAALRLTLAGAVALEAAFTCRPHRGASPSVLQASIACASPSLDSPLFFGRRHANQQHSASMYDPTKRARMALRSYPTGTAHVQFEKMVGFCRAS